MATITTLYYSLAIIAMHAQVLHGFGLESFVDTADAFRGTVNQVVDKVDLVIPFPSPAGDGKIIMVSLTDFLPKESRILPNPKYFLFTRENPDDNITLNLVGPNSDLIREKAPNFDAKAPLKVLVHGFQSSAENPFPNDMMRVYLNQTIEGAQLPNVILVDWKPIAEDYFYFRAAENTEYVGNLTAQLIQSLVAEGLTTVDKIHLVGHSLGAHTSGSVGKAVQDMGLGKINRITGLDPAGPGFCAGQKNRLSPDDAEFVMAIHTDGGDYCGIVHKGVNLAALNFGDIDELGHADFYPNGGFLQPGCVGGIACSHARAHQLMLESIMNPEAFLGHKCSSWPKYKLGLCEKTETVVMGEATPSSADGVYFLATGTTYPYARVGRFYEQLPMLG